MKKLLVFSLVLAALVSCGLKQEPMEKLADRVFDRAVCQLTLMDSNLAEKEYPRSIDTAVILLRATANGGAAVSIQAHFGILMNIREMSR